MTTQVEPMEQVEQIAWRLLAQEGRALLTRLARVRPFALYETMVPAAAPSPEAFSAIEHYLLDGRRMLRGLVHEFLRWLREAASHQVSLTEAQRRFTLLRLRFNTMLTQFDIFADAMTQRSEHDSGVWLAGLDSVAADALTLPGKYYQAPPVMCYLDRGHGAAIRRARTRLPGGGDNPVAIIRVPRERMVSSGIASSLVHEVGHQGAALLNLVASLTPVLRGLQRGNPANASRSVWQWWERWISEIVSDFWSVSRVGVGSTLGLMGVVALPRAFVFRLSLDDPHPIPWIRVKLSCAIGDALYPHPQWCMLADIWERYYPLASLSEDKQRLFRMIEDSIPSFVSLLAQHRPRALRGQSLAEVMAFANRQPAQLQQRFEAWRLAPAEARHAAPSLVFAVIGQARADGRLSPEQESEWLGQLLPHWALRKTLDV